MSSEESRHDRLSQLIAGAQLNDLTPDERAELDELLREQGEQDESAIFGELLVMLDQAGGDNEPMPSDVASRIAAGGRAAVNSQHPERNLPFPTGQAGKIQRSSFMTWAASIAAVIAVGTGIYAYTTLTSKQSDIRDYQQRVASLQEQINSNQQLLDQSRIAAKSAQERIDLLDLELREQATLLAQSEEDNLDLAERLANATTELRDAELRIARFEEPVDPVVLAERRRQLLEVPDSIQIAWQPFDLPEAPAEQRDVRGDVVWSDELQQGYIRFVGLDANDPNIEQYQVWVIDERGLEQKVSGGVFNASAEGEIIVPIEPGIDVGRVALFAVTVENPGGTWVPDLSRRVVVAPRDG